MRSVLIYLQNGSVIHFTGISRFHTYGNSIGFNYECMAEEFTGSDEETKIAVFSLSGIAGYSTVEIADRPEEHDSQAFENYIKGDK